MHVWLNEAGDEVARLHERHHALLAEQFELKDLGVHGDEHHWQPLEEVNFDPDDEWDDDDDEE